METSPRSKSEKQGQKETHSIVLVDDHPLLRSALRSILEKQPDLKIIAEADNGEEAVRLAKELAPDIIIMDITMPGLNGLEATRQIKALNPGIAILALTVHSDSEHILGILEAGAAGYLTKSVFGEEVIQAIRAIIAGETVLSTQVFKELFKHVIRNKAKQVDLGSGDKLTSREHEILRLVTRGMSNKDIAQALNLSLPTVKSYLADVFSKLRVSSRTEAVITSLRAGFLTLDDLG